jgi:hypothetical protein
LPDASLLARVKSQGRARRRFMQVIESSICWNLKRIATLIILLAWNFLRAHPRLLTRARKLAFLNAA